MSVCWIRCSPLHNTCPCSNSPFLNFHVEIKPRVSNISDSVFGIKWSASSALWDENHRGRRTGTNEHSSKIVTFNKHSACSSFRQWRSWSAGKTPIISWKKTNRHRWWFGRVFGQQIDLCWFIGIRREEFSLKTWLFRCTAAYGRIWANSTACKCTERTLLLSFHQCLL